MIPVDSRGSVIVELVLVRKIELERNLLPRDAHESVVIGEFPFGESDGVSFVGFVFCRGYSIIGLVF